jgi:hypothetical protein
MQERIDGGSLSSFAELPQKEGVTALCYTCQGGSLTCPFAWRCAFVLTSVVQLCRRGHLRTRLLDKAARSGIDARVPHTAHGGRPGHATRGGLHLPRRS